MLNMISLAINEVLYYVRTTFGYFMTSSQFGGIMLFIRPVFFVGVAFAILFVVLRIIRSTVLGR